MKFKVSLLTALLVLAVPAALAAEDIYRSTMPDGRIVYGESPFPGAKSVRIVRAPPVSTGTITVTPEEKSRASTGSASQQGSGGVVVLPQPARDPPQRAQQGRLQADRQQLPRRSY